MSNEVNLENIDDFVSKNINLNKLPKVIGLSGELGAGKTTIIKSIIKFLGCNEIVTSPTFNIVKQYKVKSLDIYHVDLYRMSSWNEFLDLDLPIYTENSIFLIEWINIIPDKFLKDMFQIEIEVIDEMTRKINLNV